MHFNTVTSSQLRSLAPSTRSLNMFGGFHVAILYGVYRLTSCPHADGSRKESTAQLVRMLKIRKTESALPKLTIDLSDNLFFLNNLLKAMKLKILLRFP